MASGPGMSITDRAHAHSPRPARSDWYRRVSRAVLATFLAPRSPRCLSQHHTGRADSGCKPKDAGALPAGRRMPGFRNSRPGGRLRAGRHRRPGGPALEAVYLKRRPGFGTAITQRRDSGPKCIGNPPDLGAAQHTLCPNPIASTRSSSIQITSFLPRPRHDCQGQSKPSRVPARGVRASLDSSDNAEPGRPSP